ncbi:MAG TPA: hypothetical protein GXZ82_05990 [Firmicutes bacterium]|nr:hypothetical protein [Bacillota bacterium]
MATGFFDLQASRAEAYERIVVVGDIHGCSAGFLRVLRLAELLDERGRWQAGSHTYLVVCGDMIDEGSESRGVISLLRSLQQQAKDRVIVLLGNHELLLLRTLLSDSDAVNWETVHSWADVDEDLKALLDDNAVPMLRTATMQQWFQHSLITTGRVDYPNDYLAACARIPQSIAKTAAHLLHRAMAKDGTLSWLLGLPVAAQLGDWGFFHGGPPSDFSGDIAALNREFTAQLMAHQWNHPLLDPYAGRSSPTATRGWSNDGEENVDALLRSYGINQVAFGHAPGAINGIFGRLAQRWGKVFKADSYFSLGVEGFLEIIVGKVWAVYSEEGRCVYHKLYPDHPPLRQAELLWDGERCK